MQKKVLLGAASIIEVLVIFAINALLIIVFLSGKQIVSSVRAQKIVSELLKYEQAVFGFKQIYDYLPGDFPNTYVWSDDKISQACYFLKGWGVLAVANGRPAASYQEIQGNGDGIVSFNIPPGEADRATCHLALAGLLPMADNVGRGFFENDATSRVSSYARGSTDVTIPSKMPGYFINDFDRIFLRWFIRDAKNFIYIAGKNFHTYHSGTMPTVEIGGLSHSVKTIYYVKRKMDAVGPGEGKLRVGGVRTKETGDGGYDADHYSNVICNKYVSAENPKYVLCAPDASFLQPLSDRKFVAMMLYGPSWLVD